MLATLERLRDDGHLTDLDVELTRLLGRVAGDVAPEVALAAALASHATGDGHVCVDLAAVAGGPVVDDVPDAPRAPALASWTALLAASPIVGAPGARRPLVLDASGRLYLYRYWRYEHELAADLRRLATTPVEGLDDARLAADVAALFPAVPGVPAPDWQRVAAVTAATRRVCIVSGGPGTGKTTTVARALAALAMSAATPLQIALVAPTGKAAARLQEAVRAALAPLPLDDAVRAAIPTEASTVHRLLGARAGTVAFRHHRGHRLPHDVVVVDEASMVDLALMAKLVAALRDDARLVLLGDKDQLSSVEAGAVLGDLCGDAPGFTPAVRERVAGITGETLPAASATAADGPLRDGIVLLRHSHRFTAAGGIARLAAAINRGDGDAAVAVLRSGTADVAWRQPAPDAPMTAQLAATARAGFAPYLDLVARGAAAREVLAALARFRVLCAHRTGPAGVALLNRIVEAALHSHAPRTWYAGRPVMVTRNDYTLELFNGDVGVTLPDPEADGALRVWFEVAGGTPRRFAPARLPAHETVYAMTVHKSQGSEFDEVVLVLPPEPSRVLSRELLYTAVTRARAVVTVWGGEAVVRAGIARRVTRSSGLRDALWDVSGSSPA